MSSNEVYCRFGTFYSRRITITIVDWACNDIVDWDQLRPVPHVVIDS